MPNAVDAYVLRLGEGDWSDAEFVAAARERCIEEIRQRQGEAHAEFARVMLADDRLKEGASDADRYGFLLWVMHGKGLPVARRVYGLFTDPARAGITATNALMIARSEIYQDDLIASGRAANAPCDSDADCDAGDADVVDVLR